MAGMDEIDYERTKSVILDSVKILHRAKWAAITSTGTGIVLLLSSIGLMSTIPINLLDAVQTSLVILLWSVIVAIGVWLPIANGSLIYHVLIKGRRKERDLLSVQNSFVRRSYLTNFEIVNAEGVSRSDKIVRHLALVFPEVKELIDKHIIKKGKKIDENISGRGARLRKRILVFSQDYDVVMSTKVGLYLIKLFDKRVTFEDVEKMVKSLNRIQIGIKIIGPPKILRVICLAKSYDKFFETSEFVKKIQELDRSFYLDLVLEEDHGYATVWID